MWDWELHCTLQCYTKRDASYKDISLWFEVTIWSSYDAGTYWILILNFNSWEDLTSQYNALMHSTESCLCFGLPNILFSSLSNSSFYAFLPHISLLQCYYLMKANHWIKTCNKWVLQFYRLPINSCIMSAGKSLARTGRKQATVTEYFDFHI